MRTAIRLAIAALGLMGSLCVAHAEDGSVTAGAAAPAPYPDDIKGQYDLADGRTLTVIASGRRVYAELDGHPRIRLVPLGGTVFVARDGSFSLRFAQLGSGHVTGVALKDRPGALPGQ